MPAFLEGGGECGARMRALDWARTSLGPAERWPSSLQTLVRVILTSRQPMFVWWGPELVYVYNDAYRTILGGKHPHAMGEPAARVWPEIWDEIGPRVASAMSTNEGTYDESLLLLMDRHGYREETYYTFSYSPVPHGDGGIGGILCANTEDTERVVGERRLATLRALAAAVAEARTPGAAFRVSTQALATNPRDLPFALLYEGEPARGHLVLLGAVGIEAGHAAAPATLALDAAAPWPLGEVLASGQPRLVEAPDVEDGLPSGVWDRPPRCALVLPLVGGSGCAGVLVVALNPYRLLDDAYRGFLTLAAHQIGAGIARARAYEEARERAESLAALDRGKTVFFGNASHELRTPLTLILGPLRDALASPARALAGPDLDAAHRNALRLLHLTNTLLDFSRFEAGRARASFVPTDLGPFTEGVASAFRSLVEGAGLSYRIACPPVPVDVHIDRRSWEKVVLNLVSNAFKHTFEGGIVVSLVQEADAAVLRVEDTGVGIAPEHLPLVFDRFHRVPGARARSHEGSGIGLALVHEVVRLHGGTIAVRSGVGEGTVFTVRIPLGTDQRPGPLYPDAAVLAPPARTGPTLYLEEASGWSESRDAEMTAEAPAIDRDTRVLLADDNPDMRRYVARLLAPHWTVEAVADGAAALQRAREAPPDLVLADVMMPRLDGLGLLRALRADPRTRSIPIVLLSARAGEEARIHGLAVGADDYLVKPFSAPELVARVRSQLELARMRRARELETLRLNEDLEHRVEARTRALHAQAAELQAVNHELSAFTYTIAHDLRGPLRTMHRFADMLVTEYGAGLDETARGYAARIAVAARRMDDMIRGLLEYSSVSRLEVRSEPIDVARMIADIRGILPDESAHLHAEGPFPRVVGDPVLLYQVLTNLLSNGCKFVGPGVVPRVCVRAERHGAWVHLVVEDNGIGIAAEHQERIFGVFERLHRPAEFEGNGIGLAIAARAAERMGGRIGVTSQPGAGSRFWLALPAYDGPESDAPGCAA